MRIVALALRAHRDDELVGRRAEGHPDFRTVDDEIAALAPRARLDDRRIVARAAFRVGQRKEQFSLDEPLEQLAMSVTRATEGERRAAQHDGWDERLEHEALAESFHQNHGLDGRAAKTAAIFRKGDAEPAEAGERAPMFPAKALLAVRESGAGVERIRVGHEAIDAVLDHRLVGG